jgi:hypothetical protein
MTPQPGPVHPHHPGGPARVIQGFFPGGKPRIMQASPAPATPVRTPAAAPLQARLAKPALQPATRPGQPPRPILPTNALQPRTAQPAAPLRPQAPQPILPKSAATGAVQPHAGNAFALPAGFGLKPRGSGQPLPEPVQKKMEAFFSTSFAEVRVHVGHEAPSIGALAFTHGTDLYFAPGQYNPQSTQGQQLLGHELTHVLQQRAGRVRNPLGSGIAVVQDPALEAEAERMGRHAASAVVPAQAKLSGTGPGVAPAHSPLSRPNTVAPNGAILPARALAHDLLQRKLVAVPTGKRSGSDKAGPDKYPSVQLTSPGPIPSQNMTGPATLNLPNASLTIQMGKQKNKGGTKSKSTTPKPPVGVAKPKRKLTTADQLAQVEAAALKPRQPRVRTNKYANLMQEIDPILDVMDDPDVKETDLPDQLPGDHDLPGGKETGPYKRPSWEGTWRGNIYNKQTKDSKGYLICPECGKGIVTDKKGVHGKEVWKSKSGKAHATLPPIDHDNPDWVERVADIKEWVRRDAMAGTRYTDPQIAKVAYQMYHADDLRITHLVCNSAKQKQTGNYSDTRVRAFTAYYRQTATT